MIKSLFRKSKAPPAPRIPNGQRVYAIGDIHGCDAQFAALLAQIDADDAGRAPAETTLILLGDYVDRGPDSAGVIARAIALRASGRRVRYLAGNHEELLEASCEGDGQALRILSRHGGRETALSYGISAADYDAADFDTLGRLLDAAIPAAHRRFLAGLEDLIEIGDYAFVHAGIRPGVPLTEQKPQDLRWIRERFLTHTSPHERFIVHGHTISETVDVQPNRLGIDTGAYQGGSLTAVGLEGADRWFLQA